MPPSRKVDWGEYSCGPEYNKDCFCDTCDAERERLNGLAERLP